MLRTRTELVSLGRLAAVLIAFLAGVPVSAEELYSASAAPGTRSLYLLDLPFLHFGPLRPAASGGLDVSFETANTFSHSWHANTIKYEFGTLGQAFLRSEAEELHLRHPQDLIYFIDGDVTRIALHASAPLGKGLSVGIEVPWISFGAPHLDSFIEGFHRGFGIGDSQRPAFPRNRFQVVLQSPYGPLGFFDRTPAAGLGDLVTTLSWRGKAATLWRLGADLAVKLPTGDADEFRGSGSLDGGLLVGASRAFGRSGRWTLRVEGGVVIPGRYRGAIPLALSPSAFFRLLVAGEVRIWSGTWISLSTVGEQSPLHRQDLGDVAAASGGVSLGIAQRLFRRGLLELWLTEQVPRFGDTEDVAIGLRMRYVPGH